MRDSGTKKRSHWPISILSTVSSLINMAIPLILVRILTKDEVGQYKIFFLYLMMIPALSFSLGIVSGLAYWSGKESVKKSAIHFSGLLLLVFAALAAIALFFASPLVTEFVKWDPQYSLILSLATFAAIASLFFEEAAIATGKIWTGAIFHSSTEIIRSLALVTTAILTRELMYVFLVHVAISNLKVVAGYVIAYRLDLISLNIKKWKNDHIFKKVISYSLPVSVACIFSVFVSHSDQFILSTFLSASDFAIYTIGCFYIPPLFIIQQSVTRVLIPTLSHSFDQNNSDLAAKLYKRAVEQIGFIVIPATAGLAVFAEPIINLLFTAQYSSSAEILRIFSLFYLLFMIPFDAVARARGQSKWIFWHSLFFAIIFTVSILVGVKFFGTMGALISAVLSRTVMKAYVCIYLKKNLKWGWSQFLPIHSASRMVITSAFLAAICILLKSFFLDDLVWFLTTGTFFYRQLLYHLYFLEKRCPSSK